MPKIEDRSDWDDDRVKKDWVMWKEITDSGRALTEEQEKRYEATRKEIEKRNRELGAKGKKPIIPIERRCDSRGTPGSSAYRDHRSECPVSSYPRGASICGWMRSTKSRACCDRYLPLRITTP